MHEQFQRLRHWQFPGWAWVLLAVGTLSVHSILPDWIFAFEPARLSRAHAFLVALHTLDALVVWSCVIWVTPFLARRYPLHLVPRMWLGLPMLVGGVVLVTAAAYLFLFPAWTRPAVMPEDQFMVAYRALMVSMFVYGWLLMRDHANEQAARTLRLHLETEALGTAVDRSELAMLEAQIEPHFLFNTLAHVKRLYRTDDVVADRVLTDLISYLRRALPALRKPDWTVDDELDLITLYLDLIAQRFGERFRYTISVAPPADKVQIPALSIATLVENAVRHGLGPKAGSGLIRISVDLRNAELVIDVSDDGVGLRKSAGNGLGLATVRARLQGKFGTGAVLVVAPAAGGGVCASIHIVLKDTDV